MPPTPAYVVSACYDILAWNRVAVNFIGDLSGVPASNRNMIRWMFDRPADDAVWSDLDAVAFTRPVFRLLCTLGTSELRFYVDYMSVTLSSRWGGRMI
jgi:hypothetical protein